MITTYIAIFTEVIVGGLRHRRERHAAFVDTEAARAAWVAASH